MSTYYAFLRLTWRPAILAWGLLALTVSALDLFEVPGGPATAFRAFKNGGTTEAGLQAIHGAIFLLPVFVGFFAGRVVKELQHCPLTWSLPSVRTKLAISFLTIAAVMTLPAAVVYWGVHEPVTWATMTLLALLLFSMSTALFDPIPSPVVSRLSLLGLLFATFMLEDLILSFQSYPVAAGALAAIGTGAYMSREFSKMAARQRPFVPTWPLGVGGEGRWLREHLTHRPLPARRWPIEYLGTNLLQWMRATEYESYGYMRFGWLGRTVAIALIVTVALNSTTDDMVVAATYVAMAAIAQHLLGSSFLKKKVPRPLSRRQRAQVAYWSSLSNNIGLCLALAIFLGAAHAWWPPTVSFGGRIQDIGGVLWPVALVFVWTPLLQWVQVRYLSCERTAGGAVVPTLWMTGASVVFSGLVVASSVAAMDRFALDSSLQEWGARLTVGIVATVGGLMQMAYWWRLQRFFRTADLV